MNTREEKTILKSMKIFYKLINILQFERSTKTLPSYQLVFIFFFI